MKTVAEFERAEGAFLLADLHYQIDDGIVKIFRATGSLERESYRDEPIKLLEVNEKTIPCGVVPLHFRPQPSRGITCPWTLIEVSPNEFKKIRSGELKLPKGWERLKEIPRRVLTR